MALTRKMLKAMGIDDEKIEQIIDAHAETTEALKNERDGYKVDADKLAGVQKQLDDANKKITEAEKDPLQTRYGALQKEYSDYKAGIAGKELKTAKEAAYKALLAEIGIPEKYTASVLKATDINALEYADGKFVKPDELKTAAKTEWADFIAKIDTVGGKVDTPPGGGGASDYDKMSDEDYYKAVTARKG